MAALAGMLVERGLAVTGSDNQLYEPTLSLLKSSRVELMTGFSPENLSPAPDPRSSVGKRDRADKSRGRGAARLVDSVRLDARSALALFSEGPACPDGRGDAR